MKQFFDYQSPYRTGVFLELNLLEFIVPIILLFFMVFLIIYFKKSVLEQPGLESKIRKIIGVIFIFIYFSHYILRFALYGFDTIVLPFQLCSISMLFAIILIFTKNKTIYSFVLYTGVLGGIISLLTPIIGYDSHYFRYYQFYIAHTLLIITPLYFMAVHGYFPSIKDTVKSFLILQSLAIFMLIFNYFNGTDFMFVLLDPEKLTKFPMISKFGGIPFYLIWVELTGITLFYVMYKVTTIIKKYRFVDDIEYKKA